MRCLKVINMARPRPNTSTPPTAIRRIAKSAAAAYAAVVSYQKGEEGLTGAPKSAWHAREIDADIKFAQAFPEHPESSGVLTRAAEDIFAAHDLPRSIQVSQLLLARTPPVDTAQQRIAWNIIGQSQYDLGVYDQAEAAFIQARERSAGADPANVKLRADLTERIAESVYRQGEARRKAGDASGAVADFLRVAKVAPDSKIVGTAQYDAAAGLINLKQWDQAIAVLEPYRKQYPNGANAEDVTRKLAVAYARGEPAGGCGGGVRTHLHQRDRRARGTPRSTDTRR